MKATWLTSGDTQASAISADALEAQGVLYARISTEPNQYRAPLDKVKSDHAYVEEDIIELRPDTPNLEGICAKFIDEHYHDDDEVRFVLGGEGIFDIRSTDDRWMRVVVEKGDLIVVPAGRHHRFMLTDKKAIRCVRLYKDESGWVPHYRTQTDNS